MRNPFMVTLNEHDSDDEATQVYDPNARDKRRDDEGYDTDHMSQWGKGDGDGTCSDSRGSDRDELPEAQEIESEDSMEEVPDSEDELNDDSVPTVLC